MFGTEKLTLVRQKVLLPDFAILPGNSNVTDHKVARTFKMLGTVMPYTGDHKVAERF